MKSPSGSRAAAYARLCAWKSRLLGRVEANALLIAADAAALQRTLAALGIEPGFDRLLRVYRMAFRAVPDAAPLLRALLHRHEIENVKLLWRTAVRHRDPARLQRLWIPLGALASIAPLQNPVRIRDVAQHLAKTPLGPIAADVARAFGDDLAAAELAFDRWISQQLLDQARRIPRSESLARRLVELLVRERDSEILRRGERWFGLSSAACRQWSSGLSRSSPADAGAASQRLRLCRRAFVGDPFALAPAIALVLLAEEEMRAVRAIVERRGDSALDAAVARAMAGAEFAS